MLEKIDCGYNMSWDGSHVSISYQIHGPEATDVVRLCVCDSNRKHITITFRYYAPEVLRHCVRCTISSAASTDTSAYISGLPALHPP